MLNIFNLFKKELGPYQEIIIPGLKVDYTYITKAGEPINMELRVLQANGDQAYTVYGVGHSPYVSAVTLKDPEYPGDKIPALLVTNRGLKRLSLKELQVLADFEILRWTTTMDKMAAKSNCQPNNIHEGFDENFPDFYSVFEASTKTRKMQLIAENGRVARRAFLKNEKSLINIPKEAYKAAQRVKELNSKLREATEDEGQDTLDSVIDLAGAVVEG